MSSSHEHQEPRVSDEGLKEILAGCEGVQGGPYHLDKQACYIWAPSAKGGDFPLADFNGDVRDSKFVPVMRLRGWGYYTGHGHGALALLPEEAEKRQRLTGEHLARLDPQTVASIVRELIERRTQPLPASGFAAGVEAARATVISRREGNMMLDNEPELFVTGYERACADMDAAIRTLTESKSP